MAEILITGADGQMGRTFAALQKRYEDTLHLADRERLDITDRAALEAYMREHRIDTVVNAAAYTAVDEAERAPQEAERINRDGVRTLAEAAKRMEVGLIHLSTEYVFDGERCRPYHEEDETHPINIYGRSKRAGEEALREVDAPRSVIIRTSWLYSSFGRNFLKTMLRLGAERPQLRVVWDQIGTPTYAQDLAEVIMQIVPRLGAERAQIYHYSNEGVASWYDFAREIMKTARLACDVVPIETSEYPTPARRPAYGLLNKKKIKERFGITIPHWRESLERCIETMGERR